MRNRGQIPFSRYLEIAETYTTAVANKTLFRRISSYLKREAFIAVLANALSVWKGALLVRSTLQVLAGS